MGGGGGWSGGESMRTAMGSQNTTSNDRANISTVVNSDD